MYSTPRRPPMQEPETFTDGGGTREKARQISILSASERAAR